MPQTLKSLSFLLMQTGLSFEFPAARVQACQFSLNGQQLIFPEGFHLLLQGL